MNFKFGEDSGIYNDEKNNFEFPVNIRQMGCIDEKRKIYIEDYVYTYLYQYAKLNDYNEKLAVLVGRYFNYDDYDVIIISGAIQCKHTINQNGFESFTKETWNYINEQIEIYFANLDVVGWVHTLPGYGAVLMSKDEEIHRTYFNQIYHQLFVIDAEDKMDRIFSLDSNNRMTESKGYFIYYDKNRSMQEYMLDNILVKPKDSIINDFENLDNINIKNEIGNNYNDRLDAAQKIRSVLKEREDKFAEKSKIRYSTLIGICSFLCIFCFIMGVSLLNSSNRINQLENEVVSVKTKYLDISEQVQKNNVASVFAAQSGLDNIQNRNYDNIANIIQDDYTEQEQLNLPKLDEEIINNESNMNEQSVVLEDSNVIDIVPQQEIRLPNIYIVKEGDTLGEISTKFYGTVKMTNEIMAANGITDANKIIVGKELIIP